MKTFLVVCSLSLLSIVCVASLVGADDVMHFERSNGIADIEDSVITCPNNRTKCSTAQTCCKTKHNSFHCCRYRNAVCCPDRFHCCPEGSTCDTETKRCKRDNNYDAMIPSMPSRDDPMEWKVEKVDEKLKETCPNKKMKCKDTQTCCLTKKGNYHCCKYKNAVCCSDKYHCCPEDSTCDLKRKKCNSNSALRMLELLRPLRVFKSSEEIAAPTTIEEGPVKTEATCPNNKTKCKDTKTCCVTLHGNYYCCPHKNAVCCSDKWLCCPEGNTCDVKKKKCIAPIGDRLLKLLVDVVKKVDEYVPSHSPEELVAPTIIEDGPLKSEATCPNNKTKCKDTKTCCVTLHGNYYCCPHKNAVCCSDKWLCCPEGNTCDVKKKKCIAPIGDRLLKLLVDVVKKVDDHVPSHSPEELVAPTVIEDGPLKSEATCPNNKTKCKDTKTCCVTLHGNYYCCPHKNAVCCSDKWLCCPEGNTCDVKKKKCIAPIDGGQLNLLGDGDKAVDEHLPPKPISEISDNVRGEALAIFLFKVGSKTICPNHSICPGFQTCCPLSTGGFGCCPYPMGTCCPDMNSCCPHNTHCYNGSCI